MTVFHPESLWDHSERYKAASFIKVTGVYVGSDYCIKLHDTETIFSCEL